MPKTDKGKIENYSPPEPRSADLGDLRGIDAYDGRRSSSSSSSASSGKHLVRHNQQTQQPSAAPHRNRRYCHYGGTAHSSSSSSNPSPEVPKRKTAAKNFFLSPPTPPELRNSAYHVPLSSESSSSSATGSSNTLEVPSWHESEPRLKSQSLHSVIAEQLSHSPAPIKKGPSLYDIYWKMPRKARWCAHPGDCHDNGRKCSRCELKEDDASSTCSSLGPPPTFTMDHTYRQAKRRQGNDWCTCSTVLVATIAFSCLILSLIAAFIIYTEMVIKKKQYVPDPM